MTNVFLIRIIIAGLAIVLYGLFWLGILNKVLNEAFLKFFIPTIIFMGFLELSEFLVDIVRIIKRLL